MKSSYKRNHLIICCLALLLISVLTFSTACAGSSLVSDGSAKEITITASNRADLGFSSKFDIVDLDIPEYIYQEGNYYQVVGIGDGAFSGCTNFTNLTLPESLKYIGKNAFNGCDGLTTVIFPGDLESIGERAFYQCSSLAEIEIPASVTEIGEAAFKYLKDGSMIYNISSVALEPDYHYTLSVSEVTEGPAPGSVYDPSDDSSSEPSGDITVNDGSDVPMISTPASAPSSSTLNKLAYAKSPADNPMKGFVTLYSHYNKNDLPHSIEGVYLPLNMIIKGEDQYDWSVLDDALKKTSANGCQASLVFYMEWPGYYVIPSYLHDEKGVDIYTYAYGNENGRIIKTGDPVNASVSGSETIGWAPDYSNPETWKMLNNFVRALGKEYDGDPRIATVLTSGHGRWGEGHTYPFDMGLTEERIYSFIKVWDDAFNKTLLNTRRPHESTQGEFRNFNMGYSDYSYCWDTLGAETGNAWATLNLLKYYKCEDSWKKYICGGELAYQVKPTIFETEDWCVRGGEGWADCVKALHTTFMHMQPELISEGREKENAIEASRMLGYDFTVRSSEFDPAPEAGSNQSLKVNIENLGVAPFYYNWKMKIGIFDSKGRFITSKDTDWDIRTVMPESGETSFTANISLKGLDAGETYSYQLFVVNPMSGGKTLRFANASQNENGWLDLGSFKIQ